MSPAKPNPDKDERVKLPLHPLQALRALLAVNPGNEPTDEQGDETARQNRGEPDAE
jgi:hypothetical protein